MNYVTTYRCASKFSKWPKTKPKHIMDSQDGVAIIVSRNRSRYHRNRTVICTMETIRNKNCDIIMIIWKWKQSATVENFIYKLM